MLEELISTGATTFVAAMATDAWSAARTGIAALFGPPDSAAVAAQLDRQAAQVAAAPDADVIRRCLAPAWELELEALITRDPDTVEALQSFVVELRDILPAEQRAWVRTTIARDSGTVLAVMGAPVIHVAGSDAAA